MTDAIERWRETSDAWASGYDNDLHEVATMADAGDALAAELERTRTALAEVHRVTGRGDGHGKPSETAGCIISACIDRQMELTETMDELELARERLRRVEALLARCTEYKVHPAIWELRAALTGPEAEEK